MIPGSDFRLTLYVSEEVIQIICVSVVCAVAIWGTVKMTDILFGKRDKQLNVKEKE
jgi:hypothetical protein